MTMAFQPGWNPELADPTGIRSEKPRKCGKTMIIDKGLGLHAFEDLLATASDHIDLIKIGFGTSPLYPRHILENKIRMANAQGICIYPGGTFLEVAVDRDLIGSYFSTIKSLGYSGVEVSDGTIPIDRQTRDRLIAKGRELDFTVITEYGKKCWGSRVETSELVETVYADTRLGAELVTIEGRESGMGVGIFDEKGNCRDEEILEVLEQISNQHLLLWEAPQKDQQVHLLKMLGSGVNFGNVAAADIFSLEALRRGLRSDTLGWEHRQDFQKGACPFPEEKAAIASLSGGTSASKLL